MKLSTRTQTNDPISAYSTQMQETSAFFPKLSNFHHQLDRVKEALGNECAWWRDWFWAFPEQYSTTSLDIVNDSVKRVLKTQGFDVIGIDFYAPSAWPIPSSPGGDDVKVRRTANVLKANVKIDGQDIWFVHDNLYNSQTGETYTEDRIAMGKKYLLNPRRGVFYR